MQISRPHHEERAIELGLDLEKFWDNIAYGRDLYEREGHTPWLAPTDCSQVAAR